MDPDRSPDSTTHLRVYDAMDAQHAGGMRANRAFPTPEQDHLDPFVLFERFYIAPDQGFGTHPHRGFEIVSYMLDGGMAHADSMGHESVAREGDAMYIRTGSGMRHSELPAENKACSGLQLWVNLPREQKDRDPVFDEADAGALPTEEQGGATVTNVVGEGSPLDPVTDMTYRDVALQPDTGVDADPAPEATWTWTVPDGWTGYCYVVSGDGALSPDGSDDEPESVESGSVAIVEAGGTVDVTTTDGLRFVAVSGDPHGDPIRQRGPFVD